MSFLYNNIDLYLYLYLYFIGFVWLFTLWAYLYLGECISALLLFY